MSKHERRAPRQSQLKLKVEGKDSAVQMARTGVLLAPKQQLPPQMARTGWRQISNSNRMRNICRNGARSEADLAQCGALALPPPFLFLWLLVQTFFFNAPFPDPNNTIGLLRKRALFRNTIGTKDKKKSRKERKNERRRNQYARVRRYKITSTLGLLVRGDPQNEGLRGLQPRALGSKLDYFHAGITSTRLHRYVGLKCVHVPCAVQRPRTCSME